MAPVLGLPGRPGRREALGRTDRVEALQLAERENREVVDRSPHFGRRRANHVSNRVNVLLDDDGGVVMAELG